MNSAFRLMLILFPVLHVYDSGVFCSLPLLPSVPIVIRRLLDWNDDRTAVSFFHRFVSLKSWFTDFSENRCSNRGEWKRYCEPMNEVLEMVAEIVELLGQNDYHNFTKGFTEEQGHLPKRIWLLLSNIDENFSQSRGKFADTLPVLLTAFENLYGPGDRRQPSQMYLIRLFEYVATAELLGHHLITYPFQELIHSYEDDIFFIVRTHDGQSIDRIAKYFKLTMDSLPNASRDLVVSNPPNYIRDSTFIEMEGFRQSIVVKTNEACEKINGHSGIKVCDMKRDFVVRHAFRGKFFVTLRFLRNDCQPLSIGRQCTGPAIDCHDMTLDSYSYLRPSKHLWKRWDVISSSNQDNNPFSPLLSIFAYNTQECLCTCIDNGANSFSKNVISLVQSESAWTKNKIIVGVRFRKKNGILYIQIREATLKANGNISNEQWVEPSGIDENIYTLNENTGFDLDDLKILGPEMLVVGVGFHVSTKSNRVSLVIKGLSYNYASGYLSKSLPPTLLKYKIDNQVELSVSKIQLLSTPVSTPTIHNSIPGKHFIKFTTSEMESDGGQSTYPFFDTQNVEGRPSFIVVGIGIYHQTAANSAGTISLRIFCTNYHKLIKTFEKEIRKNPTSLNFH